MSAAGKDRILFVDDEVFILTSLRRLLRGRWDMVCVSSGEEALQLVKSEPFDVVVSDMRMPGTDGVEVLEAVRMLQPGTGRIILSGHSEHDALLRALGSAHDILSKPCPRETILDRVESILEVRRSLCTEDREAVLGVSVLPSGPRELEASRRISRMPDPSADQIMSAVRSDPGITAKLIHMANMGYFGLAERTGSLRGIIASLGLGPVSGLFRTEVIQPGKGAELAFIDQARQVAEACHAAALELGVPAEESRLAGLLHRIGCLLDSGRERASAEICCRDQSGAIRSHALLKLWRFPEPVIEAVRWCDEPSASGAVARSVLTAVHLGVNRFRIAQGRAPTWDREYLASQGVGEFGQGRKRTAPPKTTTRIKLPGGHVA